MDAKKTFWASIIVGACVGGLLSLLNKDVRAYSKDMVKNSTERLSDYAKNPERTVQQLKETVVTVNKLVSENSKGAMNALNQVENTVNKFIN